MTKERAAELVELIDDIAIERAWAAQDPENWTHHSLDKVKAKLAALLESVNAG